MPPSLFRVRSFVSCVCAQLAFQAAPAALFFVWTLYAQGALDWSPLRTGLSILPFCVLLVVSGGISTQVVVKRFGRNGLFAGIVLMLAGVIALVLLVDHEGAALATWHLILPFSLLGAGMGQIVAPLTTFALAGVPPEEAGAASGLVNVTFQLGAAVGVALVGLVIFRADNPTGALTASAWLIGALLLLATAAMIAVPRAAARAATATDAPAV